MEHYDGDVGAQQGEHHRSKMQNIKKIKTKYWQHKRGSIGEIAVGIHDIKQCVDTVITTNKGTVPLMPELGCDQIEAIGETPEVAIDILKTIWLKEIPLQVPRCEVIDIVGESNDDGRILMKIYFKDKTTGKKDYTKKYLQYQGVKS